MTFRTDLVEGFFLITSDNLIFEVKGVAHPPNRVIAYVRYIPDTENGMGYQKIYDLIERENYLKREFPEYLWYSEYHGRVLQSVPTSRINRIFDPVEKLSHMRRNIENLSAIGQTTVMLSDRLLEFIGIPETSIGITGSQLVDLANKNSDIDIVIYGEAACRLFYNHFSKYYESIPGLERYSGTLLDRHVNFRWKDLTRYKGILRNLERQKILQGVIDGREFFIRLVRLHEDIDEIYGCKTYELLEPCEVTCVIIDDSESIFTPCTYRVESSEKPDLKRLVSFRGRFTEQVSKGNLVRARGRLERVVDNRLGESFNQLVLGESSSDFLIPI